MSALPAPSPITRHAASTRALGQSRVPVWLAGELAHLDSPTLPTGWQALDGALPGGGWPMAGLVELLVEHAASGELTLLAPWLKALAQREGSCELLWVAPPGLPCVAALQAMGLPLQRLVCVQAVSAVESAWAVEQALRSGSCAAVLWWSLERRPTAAATLRRLHLAAQAGGTPLMAVRSLAARTASSPAPLRLACTPQAGRRLAVDVFKRRGPPMAAPLVLPLPWPASSRRPAIETRSSVDDVVDRPAPAPVAAASSALVAAGA